MDLVALDDQETLINARREAAEAGRQKIREDAQSFVAD
jgi:hypothetical protein